MSSIDHVDQRLLDALKSDDPGQSFDLGLDIQTDSGSLYRIAPDSTMICLEGSRKGKEVGVAQGSIYRTHGPMRKRVAVVGLRIEALRENGQRKIFITSPVVKITPQEKRSNTHE